MVDIKNKIALLGLLFSLCSQNVIYSNSYIITDIDYKNDLVTISTTTGIEYQFFGCEDYMTGDIISCIMFTNYTEIVTDDIILHNEYSGTIENFKNIADYYNIK